jgi:AcrR family transcriptional regulator
MEPSTARRIMDVTVRLFAANGYQATGIRDIAAAAKVSSAAPYHYMGGKQDLLVRIMERNLRRWTEGARRACRGIDAPEARAPMFVRVHAMTAARHRLESTVVATEVRSLRQGARRRVVALRDEFEALLARAVGDGRAAGVFQIEDVRLARLALVEMCNGVSRWYSPRGPATLAELGDHFAEMSLALLRARRGSRPLRLADVGLPPATETLRVLVETYAELDAAAPEDEAWALAGDGGPGVAEAGAAHGSEEE